MADWFLLSRGGWSIVLKHYCIAPLFPPFLFFFFFSSQQAQTYYLHHFYDHSFTQFLPGAMNGRRYSQGFGTREATRLCCAFSVSSPDGTQMRTTLPKPVLFFLGIKLNKYNIICSFLPLSSSYSHPRMGFSSSFRQVETTRQQNRLEKAYKKSPNPDGARAKTRVFDLI